LKEIQKAYEELYKLSIRSVIKDLLNKHKIDSQDLLEMGFDEICRKDCFVFYRNPNFYNHVYFCLKDINQVETFFSYVKSSITLYVDELGILKEKTIQRIENHLASNQRNLTALSWKCFEKNIVIDARKF
jgi:hypothetical protein